MTLESDSLLSDRKLQSRRDETIMEKRNRVNKSRRDDIAIPTHDTSTGFVKTKIGNLESGHPFRVERET